MEKSKFSILTFLTCELWKSFIFVCLNCRPILTSPPLPSAMGNYSHKSPCCSTSKHDVSPPSPSSARHSLCCRCAFASFKFPQCLAVWRVLQRGGPLQTSLALNLLWGTKCHGQNKCYCCSCHLENTNECLLTENPQGLNSAVHNATTLINM